MRVIVLHGVWSRDGRLCVWAEDSQRPASAPPRRGRPPATPRPRAHPFAADVAQLRAALATTGVPDQQDKRAEDTVVLRLPSLAGGPAHSPQIRRDGEIVGTARWIVPVVAFPADAALDVLLTLPPNSGPVSPGVVIGDSLPFLATVGKLALELLARGRVLPGLRWQDGNWEATWEPVLTDPLDADRARRLGVAIPALL